MFSTDFIFRQQENFVDNQKCQAGFRPLYNKILFIGKLVQCLVVGIFASLSFILSIEPWCHPSGGWSRLHTKARDKLWAVPPGQFLPIINRGLSPAPEILMSGAELIFTKGDRRHWTVQCEVIFFFFLYFAQILFFINNYLMKTYQHKQGVIGWLKCACIFF